jgi:hypothetical protein
LPWQEGNAETRLAKLRLTYEPYFYAIAQYLVLSLPEWSPTAAPDNWQRGDHGKLAKELIDTTDAVVDGVDRLTMRTTTRQ